MYLWRISKFADLSGRGGALRSGRWHQRGTPVVYCSDHPSTALLEVLVHIDFEDFPASYTLLKIACPDDLTVQAIGSEEVDLADLADTQTFGNPSAAQQHMPLFRAECGHAGSPQRPDQPEARRGR